MRTIDRETCLHSKCCFQPKEYPCIHELCTQYINVENCRSVQQLKAEIRSVTAIFKASVATNNIATDVHVCIKRLREISAV